MLQFIISFLPMAAIIITALILAFRVKRSGICLEQVLCGFDFDWSVSGTTAQVAFFMFSVAAAMSVSLAAGALTRIAGQLILTLDIIFLLSSMLLILFHQLKGYAPDSCNAY